MADQRWWEAEVGGRDLPPHVGGGGPVAATCLCAWDAEGWRFVLGKSGQRPGLGAREAEGWIRLRGPACMEGGRPQPTALDEQRKSQEQSSIKSKKRPPLRRGKVSPQLPVPGHIPRPSYVGSKGLPELCKGQLHDAQGITGMRAACKLAARVLDFAGTLVKPSITTNEIDAAVHNMIIEAGAYPSPLGYCGFPKSICTSVNECVCHGIPDSTQLQNGDIINIDVNVFLNGYHGGTSRTFACGQVDDSIKHFLNAAEECLEKGISVCRDGVNYRKIGKKISKLAYFYGYYVVERFVGHGIGTTYHSEPLILHHANEDSGRMAEGQTFTIEPILTMEKTECVTWEDGWTTVTADGSWAAQFEHTILVTRNGAEILTKV